jgi:hypothetical protein
MWDWRVGLPKGGEGLVFVYRWVVSVFGLYVQMYVRQGWRGESTQFSVQVFYAGSEVSARHIPYDYAAVCINNA